MGISGETGRGGGVGKVGERKGDLGRRGGGGGTLGNGDLWETEKGKCLVMEVKIGLRVWLCKISTEILIIQTSYSLSYLTDSMSISTYNSLSFLWSYFLLLFFLILLLVLKVFKVNVNPMGPLM